jgi:hypothetical protein
LKTRVVGMWEQLRAGGSGERSAGVPPAT